jgi:hypothetical protein
MPGPRSSQLFTSLITSYAIRSVLFSHLTPYSIASILNILKLGDAACPEEKLRFLNPMRLLFTDHELIEVTQRIAKDHAIAIWGIDLEPMVKVLRNPESATAEDFRLWPRIPNLAIRQNLNFSRLMIKTKPLLLTEMNVPAENSFTLPGVWKPTRENPALFVESMLGPNLKLQHPLAVYQPNALPNHELLGGL